MDVVDACWFVGFIVGGIFVLLLIAEGVVWYLKYRKRQAMKK